MQKHTTSKETNRETDRHSDDTHRSIYGATTKHTNGPAHGQTNILNKEIAKHKHRFIDRLAIRQTDRQTDRQTETDRKTDRPTGQGVVSALFSGLKWPGGRFSPFLRDEMAGGSS